MTITYEVYGDGHVIIATASGTVTHEEFIAYELAHATDERVNPPLSEIMIIKPGAFANITEEDIAEVLRRRRERPNPPVPHRCAIVVSSRDVPGWDLAQLYAGMAKLHHCRDVVVFGDERTARAWLGVGENARR